MSGTLTRLAIAAALLALLALTWWLPNALTERTTLFDGEPRHEPDYTIENFTAVAMDASGWRRYELRAVKLVHYPDDDTMELEKPYLVQYSPDAAPVHTRADRGYMTSKGTEILMRGNVRVTRGSIGAREPAGEVTSQELRVELQ